MGLRRHGDMTTVQSGEVHIQSAMDDDDFRDEIAQLEARSEALSQSIGRCVKISLASKLAIAAGAIWIALVLLLVIPYIPETVVAAMAAVIGGVVLLGSNASTWKQAEADLRIAEATRADLIGRMDLRVIGEQKRTFH
jgi:hypothetical protein